IAEWVVHDSRPVHDVARDFRISVRTARKWIKRYRQHGVAGLDDKTSAPRAVPRRLIQPGKELNDAIMTLLHTPPSAHGFNRTAWRMEDIKTTLDHQGTVATLNSIRT